MIHTEFTNHFRRSMQGGVGIPALRWSGAEGDYNVLVILFLINLKINRIIRYWNYWDHHWKICSIFAIESSH